MKNKYYAVLFTLMISILGRFSLSIFWFSLAPFSAFVSVQEFRVDDCIVGQPATTYLTRKSTSDYPGIFLHEVNLFIDNNTNKTRLFVKIPGFIEKGKKTVVLDTPYTIAVEGKHQIQLTIELEFMFGVTRRETYISNVFTCVK